MRRDVRYAFVYVSFGLLCFMAACNTDAKEENLTREEAIIAKTIEQAESVEWSVYTYLDRKIKVTYT